MGGSACECAVTTRIIQMPKPCRLEHNRPLQTPVDPIRWKQCFDIEQNAARRHQ